MASSPISEDQDMLETLIGPTGSLELQFSYGKWPGSGIEVDKIDVLRCDGGHTDLHIRRQPRMTRRPTDIMCGDAIVASVGMVPAEEGSRTKHISIHSLEEVSGTICSSGPYYSYKAEISFPQSDLPSHKCMSRPGPRGPQIEIFSHGDENPCATILDVTKPFEKRTTCQIQITVPLANAVNLYIILCIAADVVNEMTVFEQKAKQNAILSDCCCVCTVS
eukprot:scaffold26645_cov150-Skeletonema_menzelii.AAC.13